MISNLTCKFYNYYSVSFIIIILIQYVCIFVMDLSLLNFAILLCLNMLV